MYPTSLQMTAGIDSSPPDPEIGSVVKKMDGREIHLSVAKSVDMGVNVGCHAAGQHSGQTAVSTKVLTGG